MVGLAACTAKPTSTETSPFVSPPCAPVPGWEALLAASEDDVIIFGELHGTAEAPAAVAEIVCAAASEGPVLLAIEWNARDNDGLQTAWVGSHDSFPEALNAHAAGWNDRQDGVGSQAMLDMLVRLHALKAAGRDIDIAAFNGARDDVQEAMFEELPGQEPHEMRQATNIDAAVNRRSYRHIFVLVGSLHAKKTGSGSV